VEEIKYAKNVNTLDLQLKTRMTMIGTNVENYKMGPSIYKCGMVKVVAILSREKIKPNA
jgi:hypothetical protein